MANHLTSSSHHNYRGVFLLLCCGSFLGAFNSLLMIPLLPLVVRDFGVDVSLGSLLVAAPTLVSAVMALWVAPAMDKRGRKPFVVFGLTLIGVSMLIASIAPSFWAVVALRALAGLGMAGLMPATISAAGEYFSYEERGKAMGWAISANGVAPLLGVPLGSVLAGLTSWRWTLVLLSVLSLVLAMILLRKLPSQTIKATRPGGTRDALVGALRHRAVSVGILTMALQSAYWFCVLSFMGALFFDQFGLPEWALGTLNFTTGSAMILGSSAGGRIADRFGKRPTVLVAGLISGCFGIALTTVAATAALAYTCLFLFALPNGARSSSSQALMSELLPNSRATVMSLAGAAGNLGASSGAAIAGLVVGLLGYTAIGPTTGLLCLVSLVLFWKFVPERHLEPVEA